MGWKPFSRNPFSSEGLFGGPYNATVRLGDKGGAMFGLPTDTRKEMDAAPGKAQAEAEAAARQALFEASSKAGLERLALKRKRGFSASMLVNPASTFGSGSTFGS